MNEVALPVPTLHTIDFGLEAARAYFIAQRVLEGADTPIGHRWSNVDELTKNLYRAKEPEQRENCKVLIARNVMDIRDLKRAREPEKLSRPQLLLAFSKGE